MLTKGLELEPSDLQVSALPLRHQFPLPWNSSSCSSEWMNSVWDSSINSTLWSPWFWNEMYILRYYFLSLLLNSASVQITVMYSGLFSSPLYIQLSIKCMYIFTYQPLFQENWIWIFFLIVPLLKTVN